MQVAHRYTNVFSCIIYHNTLEHNNILIIYQYVSHIAEHYCICVQIATDTSDCNKYSNKDVCVVNYHNFDIHRNTETVVIVMVPY